MPSKQIRIQRWSVVSAKPFGHVVEAVSAGVGHPDVRLLMQSIAGAASLAELERLMQPATGSSGLMEFSRFDLGFVLGKAGVQGDPKSIRLLIGNPVIMQSMARRVPDAGSYAPVTVLIDQRPDGVHLSYDEMESLLAPYSDEHALQIARDLDGKVKALLTAAAG